MHDSVRAVTAIQITNGNIRSYARYTRTGALEFRDENTAVGIPTCLYGKLYEYSRTGTWYSVGSWDLPVQLYTCLYSRASRSHLLKNTHREYDRLVQLYRSSAKPGVMPSQSIVFKCMMYDRLLYLKYFFVASLWVWH